MNSPGSPGSSEHKYLRIGKKLQKPHQNNLSREQASDIKQALQLDQGFIDFCDKCRVWSPDGHNNLKAILEPNKNQNGFYVDIYGERVSYNGIRTLKTSNTKLHLSKIHKNELRKCKEDFKYFRKHYCLITTRDGIARPEPRDYQENLENQLLSGDDLAVSFSRQSGKTVTTSTYILWLFIFHDNTINIGVVGNRPKTAREVLDKIRKISILLPIWMQPGIEVWNKGEIEQENGSRIMTDSASGDAFRGFTCAVIFVDEVGYINTNDWNDFQDSVIPTMASLKFKQLIYTSTAAGMNHWAHIVIGAKEKTNGMTLVENDWRKVPHFDKNGGLLDAEVYKAQVIRRQGKKFFLSTEENEFLGSSFTLVSGEALKRIEGRTQEVKTIPQAVLNGGEMYHMPEVGHNYIISVDAAKDGIDDFSIDVTDISQFPFEQVFTANLQVDYLVMPEHLNELGQFYNNGLMIIENLEGAGQSISDTLWSIYEYENMYRDRNIDGKPGFKKYTGFRPTTKSRGLILNLLKIFIDEEKLIINSQETLNQLYTFEKEKHGNKYMASDGHKDDAVMSLAIMFAPFMHNKTFDDFKLFVKELKIEESKQTTIEFLSALDIGFSSDDDGQDDAHRQMEQTRKMLQESGQTEYAAYDPSAFTSTGHTGGLW